MIRGISNSIKNTAAIRNCTSCQMCSAVCNRQAITISLDKEGFYTPVINEHLCVECGECISVCAMFDSHIELSSHENLSNYKLYAASAIDEAIVKSSTSGGIGDILAKSFIKHGYSVIGVVYNPEENRAEHAVAMTDREAEAFKGSKYIQSYSADAFRHLVKHSANGKIAVFGLPCQIYAIRKFINKRRLEDNFVLVDLYCHGCPSMLVWEKVSEDIKARMKTGSFSSVNWRSKYRGWGRFFLEVKTNEGIVYRTKPNDNYFFDLFFSNHLLKSSCANCLFRSTLEYTDIRLGDFWGAEYKSNYKGVSAISVVSKKGKDILERIKPLLSFEEKAYESFLPYQSWGKIYEVDEVFRQKLFSLLCDPSASIKECIRPLRRKNGLLNRLKRIIKQFLNYLPLSVERRII